MTIPNRHKNTIQLAAKYANKAYSRDIDGIFLEDTTTDAQAFVAYDKDSGTLVVTGQGTTSVTDWKIDLSTWRTKVDYLHDVKVHAGFVKQYNAVREQIHTHLADLLKTHKQSCSRILCTGHSLFGAIATMCALDCALKYDLPIHCVSFGSPRVGSASFAKLFNGCVDVSYRCVLEKDPVTFTPIPLRFKHVRGGIKLTPHGADEISLHNFCGCRIAHHNMKSYESHCNHL